MTEQVQKNKPIVYVIDDDEATRTSIEQMLKLRGYEAESFASAEPVLKLPEFETADCIITDVKMPGMNGEQFLAEVIRRGVSSPVIMITGHGDISMAVRCLKTGAYDFVEKPFEDEVLIACVKRAVEKTALKRESRELRRRLEQLSPAEDGRFNMIGRSLPMLDLYEQIESVARSDASVLIIGETGVGKELVARAIHDQSPFSTGPFIPVNTGALPETMLESELFGHAKGAFTGALTQRDGKLVTASGGTLLLDEVECLSQRAQVELLRVLEDGIVQPLGEDKPRKVNFRLLAATNVDLKEEVRKGNMREDFYHRIMVLPITVPALRERVDDIPLLVSYFIRQTADRSEIVPPNIPEKTVDEMLRYVWPGNVRELKNAVERMIITSHDGIAGAFIPLEGGDDTRLLSLPSTQGRLRMEMERIERDVIVEALRENRGEISMSARGLGISRRALYERMKKYSLTKEDFH
jgi:two-component system C4-dicarboxylate transport response regulator DctD